MIILNYYYYIKRLFIYNYIIKIIKGFKYFARKFSIIFDSNLECVLYLYLFTTTKKNLIIEFIFKLNQY